MIFLAFAPAIVIPTPLPVAALYEIQVAVSRSKDASAPWHLSENSWTSVWSPEVFGENVGTKPVDVRRFRFRVPPDHLDLSYASGPYAVEAYLDGFPVRGLRSNGNFDTFSRPLGFRYGHDGLVTNASVLVRIGGNWNAPSLTRRGKTSLLTTFALSEQYYAFPNDRPVKGFGQVWFKIVGEGGATYWIDHDMRCIGPFGNEVQLEKDQKGVVEEILEGRWNELPKKANA